ncbi:hypothetical protein Tco_0063317, partial [Tanacetum coccineum]
MAWTGLLDIAMALVLSQKMVKYISDPIILLYEVSFTGLPARSGPSVLFLTNGDSFVIMLDLQSMEI